jgi:copper chaperone CopZ
MRKILLHLLVLLIIFTLTACGEDEKDNTETKQPPEQPANGQPTEDEPTTKTTELTVWNMTCVRCENKIINALSEIDGVISVWADSKTDKVTVEHDPDLDITLIESAITGEGFNLP